MSDRDFDAVFYVKTVPEIRLEDGHFHICYTVGRAQIEFVLRPSLFQAARRKSSALLKEFDRREGGVVGIKDGKQH